MENREVRNPFVSPKNASPEELKALRKKIQQQQRKRILKAILISVLILGLLLVGILIVF